MLDEKENQIIENAKQAEETEEQAGEEAQEQEEEILSEEQLEIQREIESYQSKIEELDAKLAEFEAKKIDEIKRKAMRKYHYTDDQIERYLKFVDGETREEIEKSVAELAKDIPPAGDNFADPSPMNPAKQKPTAADPGELGKTLFNRIKHRIWGGGATL